MTTMEDEDKRFFLFIERIKKHPLPSENMPMERIRTFAQELTEGIFYEFWDLFIEYGRVGHGHLNRIEHDKQRFESRYFELYLYHRWNMNYPRMDHVAINGYISLSDIGFQINKPAFDLRKEPILSKIFISYKRDESSAFAMFALTRLKMEGFETFIDMSLIPGEDWHAGLEERIKNKEYDYLIALIGKETLKSDVCVKEIGWAIDAGLEIIPVWHNKFKFVSNKWNLKPEIESAIQKKHAVQVKEESASGYNTAMVELLNRFGITP